LQRDRLLVNGKVEKCTACARRCFAPHPSPSFSKRFVARER
jgi:hypothetical protein